MFKVRRYGLLLVVFVSGMLLGSLNSQLLAILGIPLLLIFVMLYDEASYTRKNVRNRRVINE